MYDLISFIIRSKTRIALLKALEKPKTPTQLSKELKTHRSSISRDLIKLQDRGFVECLDPKEKVFRFYKITKKGSETLKEVEKLS